MTKFRVEISATAEKQIRKLDRPDQVRVLRAVKSLESEPRPPGSRKLRGYDDVYRIRVGTHRVLYSVEADRAVVIVLKVGHRRNIYRAR